MMRVRWLTVSVLVMTLAVAQCLPAGAQIRFDDLLRQGKKALGLGEGLSEDKVVEGLKEALHIGTGNAVSLVSRVNGYYGNPKIKIPLPEPVRKVASVLRAVGYGPMVDRFELSMNRAAEKAAPQAKALFWDAIKQMSFEDARRILRGKDDAATLYFEDKTRDKLAGIFKPIVSESMSQVGVTRQYQDLGAVVRGLPLAGAASFDLDEYVTGKSLDGLFLMLAEEERKIRQDPAARVTDLLKEVFGKSR